MTVARKTGQPWRSLFLRMFLSIMMIVVVILVTQVLVVAAMFTAQSHRFEKDVFDTFTYELQSALDIGTEAGAMWDLRSVIPLLHMAADDRVSGIILRDAQGRTILTSGKTPSGTALPDFYLTVERITLPDADPVQPVSSVQRVFLKSSEQGSVNKIIFSQYPDPVRKQDIVGTIMLYGDREESVLLGSVDLLVFSPMYYNLTALLLRRMVMAFVITIPIALVIALIGAHLVARAVSKYAASISRTLESVAAGSYAVATVRPTIRELDQISESVDRLSRQLASHERMRQQWLRGIAHDLNTPVTALRLSIESAIDGLVPVDGTVLQRMQAELDELQRRVDSVMTLASMEAPDFQLHPQPFEVLDFTDEVLRTGLFARSIELDLHTETLVADRPLLLIASRELIKNACKYGNAGHPVRWHIRLAGDDAVMEVTNCGSVPEGTAQRVFEPWFRADESRSQSGSGMGLAIVRHIMEVHGGSALFESRDGMVTVRMMWPQQPLRHE